MLVHVCAHMFPVCQRAGVRIDIGEPESGQSEGWFVPVR